MAYNVGLLSTRNFLMISLYLRKKKQVSELRYYQSQNLDSAEIKTRVVLAFTKEVKSPNCPKKTKLVT